MLSQADISAIWLTLQLATTVTILLLALGTPLAWWLARSQSQWRRPVAALIAMPLVLPPTVLGFYLLIFMAPQGWLGQLTVNLGLGSLAFTFWGLVLGSMIYSLPFVVQPLYNALLALGERPLEVAATLGAGPLDRFVSVVIPMARSGFITAAALGFAHTVGEFGVVLMIGGNIPQETQVISVLLYDHVEALDYGRAHWLSGGLVMFSFLLLLALYGLQKSPSSLRAH